MSMMFGIVGVTSLHTTGLTTVGGKVSTDSESTRLTSVEVG